ncbi:MAG: TIGR02757 family protein [Candidatus Wallbacteria bacterium]|nr:TIGR02757 family protein [Candidatus Wallbacteria bacterium]
MARRASWKRLREHLDGLLTVYGARFLDTDPLRYVHRYRSAPDRELAALVASSLAYGQVGQVLASVEKVLARMGPEPARYVRELRWRDALADFRGFKHRFNDARDIVCLLEAARRALDSHGSLGDLFAAGFRPEDEDTGPALAKFSAWMTAAMEPAIYPARQLPASVRFFFPSPPGSACKRLCLFARWMARPADGLDFGQWTGVPPRALVIPLDTHIARICSYIGLTRRRTMGWEMAREITAGLRRLDPADPIKYDFAICRLGILDHCPRKRDLNNCRLCPLLAVCSL